MASSSHNNISVNLMLFYTYERELFKRLVGRMNKDPTLAKRIIAIWILLEKTGCFDLIRLIYACDDETFVALFHEVTPFLSYLSPNASEPIDLNEMMPVFSRLFFEPKMVQKFFLNNQDFIHDFFTQIMENVCNVILGAIEVKKWAIIPGVRSSSGLEMSRQYLSDSCDHIGHDTCSISSSPPQSRPSSPEVPRTVFLTFSKGCYPLRRDEITRCFTSTWGDVVESVMIERTSAGVLPKYCRVVFNSASVVGKILKREEKAKFMVNKKHLWARAHVPRRHPRTEVSLLDDGDE